MPKENIKYRIKEHYGKFTIEIYAHETKGFLWWKRIEWSWCRTNAWGGVWIPFPVMQPFSKSFESLEDAENHIKLWNSDPVYHEVCISKIGRGIFYDINKTNPIDYESLPEQLKLYLFDKHEHVKIGKNYELVYKEEDILRVLAWINKYSIDELKMMINKITQA